MQQLMKYYDRILGITDRSIEIRITKLIMGIIVPTVPVLYGIAAMLSGHSKFIGRQGWIELTSFAAVAAGLGYLCLGVLIHVHNCWVDHPKLAGVADAARVVLILGVALALVVMFISVLK